ncbi:unnamed protein product [Acanthoscelides obtectus]|uniref:Uncharacterized protein n=1 Tax=Acanthoscelides obtectus TaxID=200917 RepID=A0A9P0QFQ3_ACAOB|nr:unnamed protein product [Acanthoscelides obtectus]CAK1683559.1 hypothetical protein AOBTE_LOCUS34315 [Acanthoscelides obtectus]
MVSKNKSINYHILSEEEEDNSLICSESIESTPSPEAPASTAPGPSTTTTTTTTTTTKNIQQKQSYHCNKREKASALPNLPTKNITIQVENKRSNFHFRREHESESDDSGSEIPSGSKKIKYSQKFNKTWLNDPDFKAG